MGKAMDRRIHFVALAMNAKLTDSALLANRWYIENVIPSDDLDQALERFAEWALINTPPFTARRAIHNACSYAKNDPFPGLGLGCLPCAGFDGEAWQEFQLGVMKDTWAMCNAYWNSGFISAALQKDFQV